MRKRKIVKLTLRKVGKVNLLGIGSLACLGVLGLVLLLPTVDNSVSATESNWANASTQFNARVQPTISISVPDSVSLDIVQGASDDTFYKASGLLAVNTNNASGYRILVSSNSGTAALTSLDNASPNAVIDSIAKASTAGEFTNNTWGYYITSEDNTAETIYQPMSVATTEALKVNTASSTATYNLGFGTKIDTSLPAGTYSNSILISAVANPLEVHSLMDLTFMQDMTSSICAETPSAYNASTGKSDTSSPYYLEPVTKQLYDIRDGNMYWVAKLADGSCWMTQNLALDLSIEKTLTPSDTDITKEWTPSNSTNEVKLTGEAISIGPQNALSWNFGQIVFAIPFTGESCDNYAGNYNSATSNDNLGSVCAKIGLIDVSSSNWQPTLVATMGNYNYNNTANLITTTPNTTGTTFVTVDTGNKTYDSHYLIGNYYQYNTAVAGSSKKVSSGNGNAPESICPRGWKLPIANRQTDGYPIVTDDFYKLLLAYGYPKATDYTIDTYNNALTPILNPKQNTQENPAAAPMSLTRSGIVGLNEGYLRTIGRGGNYWSATFSNGNIASRLFISTINSIYPAAFSATDEGYSVRCTAR